jgi:hypothetical protein
METIRAYETSVNYQIARGHVPNGNILKEITYLEEDFIDYGNGNAVVTLKKEEIHYLYSRPNIIRLVR